MDDKLLISALHSLRVADLNREDWIKTGMALKEEGYPCSVWEEWSRNDKRFKNGECQKLWDGFHGSDNPVAAGTIVQMAKDRGFEPPVFTDPLDWNDVIEYDGDGVAIEMPEVYNGVADLKKYIETLFKPDDIVCYTSTDTYKTEDGKWVPRKGVYTRTAGDLLRSLKKYPDDITMTIGSYKPEAGAWIRFNAFDGKGVTNNNVTTFRYALVESDTLSVDEQKRLYTELELPIAALVYSGKKSLHAIVKVDAKDAKEYRERVQYLYDYLEKNGVEVDRQNNNPSRLSRMPGVLRSGNSQYLAGVNLGRKDWADWVDYVEGKENNYPKIVSLADYWANPPVLRDPLIDGILRQGHKMLMSGPSKAGKSMNLMQLAVCLAEGIPWLEFQVKKGRILYVNLEIDEASFANRFFEIYHALQIEPNHLDDIKILNFRGYALPMNEMVPILLGQMNDTYYDAVILDPIYKVMMGDENSASDMGKFSNEFDKICNETGASMIYCHHHSKGAQGGKKVIDRASGSGVFARDPDAIIDLVELEMTDDIKNNVAERGATAWRMEGTLREFAPFKPKDIWFEYPIHRVAQEDELSGAYIAGSAVSNFTKSSKNTTTVGRRRSVENAFDALYMNNIPPSIKDMASYMQVTERCARDRIKEQDDMFLIKNNLVFRIAESDDED